MKELLSEAGQCLVYGNNICTINNGILWNICIGNRLISIY